MLPPHTDNFDRRDPLGSRLSAPGKLNGVFRVMFHDEDMTCRQFRPQTAPEVLPTPLRAWV